MLCEAEIFSHLMAYGQFGFGKMRISSYFLYRHKTSRRMWLRLSTMLIAKVGLGIIFTSEC